VGEPVGASGAFGSDHMRCAGTSGGGN
jgi:hypothetical protein